MQLKYALVWLGIVALASLIARFAFGSSFWIGAGLAAFSLIVNGLVIEWEDRQKGGWSE
jgi:hypothetical protein